MCTSGLSIWGDIANIVIAVASVATAVVTAVVLFKQRNDNIKEKQPRFSFNPKDGYLIIRGETEKCLQIEGVDTSQCVEAWRFDKKIRKIIPLDAPSSICLRQDEKGQYVSVGLDVMLNVKIANKFNTLDIDYHLWNYRTIELLCVKYIDLHLSHCEQYFVNRCIVSKKEYKKYFREAKKVSKVPLAVSDIDLKKVLKFK